MYAGDGMFGVYGIFSKVMGGFMEYRKGFEGAFEVILWEVGDRMDWFLECDLYMYLLARKLSLVLDDEV